MPKRGREVVAAGADVLQHRDDGAGGVRGAQAEGAERVALRLDLLPHAQLAEDPQGVALEGDAGAEVCGAPAFSKTSTSIPASASRMAAVSPAAPAPTIPTLCTAAIADSFVLTALLLTGCACLLSQAAVLPDGDRVDGRSDGAGDGKRARR